MVCLGQFLLPGAQHYPASRRLPKQSKHRGKQNFPKLTANDSVGINLNSPLPTAGQR